MQHDSGDGAPRVDEPDVLYEDEHMLVLNKPAGMMVHNDGKDLAPTLVDWFLERVPEAKGVGEEGFAQKGEKLERSGVVHRIDRETSGIVMLAKTQEAFAHLKAQFQNHEIKKEYRTIVYGTMKEKWGTIERPIGRSRKDFRLRSAQRGARGMLRDAVTDWELIGQSETHAYLRIKPKTGRTHQIRVHMKAIGHPLVHDELYAPEDLLQGDNLGFDRLALHAYSIKFTRQNGDEQLVLAPLPLDFEKASTAIATA